MNVMKRAWLYLSRKKGRTLLMLGLLLLMSLSVLVGISFKENAEKELDRLRKSLASGFLLKVDSQNKLYYGQVDHGNGLISEDYAGPFITYELIGKICSMDGVKGYVVQLRGIVYPNLMLRPGEWAMAEPDEVIPEEELSVLRNTAAIYYLRKGELDQNFRTGALTIREGENIEEGDHFKVVISDWLAQKNHLSVGSTVTLEIKQGNCGPGDDPMETLGEPVTAEVKGLFHANFTQESSIFTVEHDLIENVIYADMDTAERLRGDVREAGYRNAAEDGYIKVEFLVEDPKELDAIMRRIEEREDIDLENMWMETDDADYRAVAEPYRQIRVFGMILLGLGICGMGVILFLAMRLWMQGRRREIGILYSIGLKKGKILWQMLTECLLVSAAAVLLALLLSGPALGWCADAAERLSAPKAHEQSYEAKIVAYQLVIERTSSDGIVLERTVSAETAGFMALFVCGISCAGVLWSFGKASRFEPGKLLKLG